MSMGMHDRLCWPWRPRVPASPRIGPGVYYKCSVLCHMSSTTFFDVFQPAHVLFPGYCGTGTFPFSEARLSVPAERIYVCIFFDDR